MLGQITPPNRHAYVRAPDRDRQFERLYRQHRSYMYTAARRLGVHAEDLDDVVQQAFIIAHARLHSYEGRSTMAAWLVGILRNVVRNASRRVRRRLATFVHGDLDDDSACPECNIEDLLLQCAALDMLLHLDEKQREAFVAYAFDGRTLREIAESTGSSIGAVHARIQAARSELSCRLSPGSSA